MGEVDLNLNKPGIHTQQGAAQHFGEHCSPFPYTPLSATAWAEGAQLNGRPFPATAWAEGAQLNGRPSP
jgi:hypothetical protein